MMAPFELGLCDMARKKVCAIRISSIGGWRVEVCALSALCALWVSYQQASWLRAVDLKYDCPQLLVSIVWSKAQAIWRVESYKGMAVASHILQKTSEMWGTRPNKLIVGISTPASRKDSLRGLKSLRGNDHFELSPGGTAELSPGRSPGFACTLKSPAGTTENGGNWLIAQNRVGLNRNQSWSSRSPETLSWVAGPQDYRPGKRSTVPPGLSGEHSYGKRWLTQSREAYPQGSSPHPSGGAGPIFARSRSRHLTNC
jgi:hypothetical protein